MTQLTHYTSLDISNEDYGRINDILLRENKTQEEQP